jgi:rare lipoprotein A
MEVWERGDRRMRRMVLGVLLCLPSSMMALAQDQQGIQQTGKASYYAGSLQGRKTASGERMNQSSMTAASPSLPMGADAKVTNLKTGKSVDVKINDRGPHRRGRVIDVSKGAANQLGIKHDGVAPVKVEAKPADQPTPELKQQVKSAAQK